MQNERTEQLQYLIDCLEEEMPEYRDLTMPEDPGERFRVFRALCNVRMPEGPTGHTLPARFYEVEAEVLQGITKEKGITRVPAGEGSEGGLQPVRLDPRLYLWQGDITTLQADAIVNAANSQMLGCFSPLHGCIDNIIHTMAGVELREECYRYMRRQMARHGGMYEEPTGQAVVTKGYNLPAGHVIHTVGPIVSRQLTSRHRELLASCYTSCLTAAAQHGLHSVAFCCISTGVFCFPQDKAAQVAVRTVRNWLDQHPDSPVQTVVFNVFKDEDLRLYDAILNHNQIGIDAGADSLVN